MLVHHVDNTMLNQTWCLVWDSPEEDPEARFQVLLVYLGSVPRKTVEELPETRFQVLLVYLGSVP